VAIGFRAGIGQNTINGSNYDYNVLIGYEAGNVLEGGSGNILIGYKAGQFLENENNRLYIAGHAQVATGTPLIYGEFDNEFVKVNGDLEVRDEIVSSSGADIVINPDGAGRVVMGNYEFDVDQEVGEDTDNYVLTYDDATGEILLKENIQEVEGATEITFAIRNDEGASIAAGTPLYSKGEIGASERIKVGIADASDPNKMPSIGIAKDTLADGADGDAMIMGTFNTNLTGYTGADENQVLYVAVGGGLPTNVKPTGSGNLIQNMGIVLKANGSGSHVQGFKVSCIGRTNDVPNIATGNIWAGNADGVAQATDTAYIDIANGRVGIGTTSPTESLDVADTINLGKNGGDTGRLILRSSGGPTVQFAGTGVIDTTTGGASAGLTFTDTAGYEGKQRYVAFSPGTAGLVRVDRSAHATNKGGLVVQQQNNLGTNGNEIFVTATSGGSVVQSRGYGGTGLGKDILFNIGGNSANASDTETEVMRITNASALSPYSVGIGTSTPDEKLHVVGQIKVDDGSNPYTFPAADGSPDQVLTTDGNGNLTFADGGGADTNIANTDLTLDASRELQLDGYDFDIKENTSTVLGWANSTSTWSSTANWDITGDISHVGDTTHEGDFEIKNRAGTSGFIILYDADDSNYVKITVPAAVSSDTTFVLPGSDGSAGYTLQTNGSGTLEFSNEKFYEAPTAANQFKGDVVEFGSGPSGVNGDIVQGKLYYYGSNGYWEEATASAESTASGMLGIAVADDTPRFLIRGFARASAYSGFASGDVLYVKTTAGGISDTVPSGNGEIVRVVGYSTNGSTREIFFDPDKTFVEI
jgi:hypothetical protein